jgi:hypothetical protein
MATPDQIDAMHRNITILTGTGSAAALVGMASYFMSYEYKDFDRINVQGQDRMEVAFKRRRKVAQVILVIAIIIYVAGLVLIASGISFYRDEREEQAESIPSLIQQIRNADAQPSTNEPAILAGISTAIILAGMIQGAREFNKTEQFGWIGSTIYAAGWLGNAFAASMNNKSISSIKGNRLAWTLPGAAAIVAGTFIVPWQLHHNYISGPGWPVAALGYVAFTVGTSYVTDPPQIES